MKCNQYACFLDQATAIVRMILRCKLMPDLSFSLLFLISARMVKSTGIHCNYPFWIDMPTCALNFSNFRCLCQDGKTKMKPPIDVIKINSCRPKKVRDKSS